MITRIILVLAVAFSPASTVSTGCDTKADITFLLDNSNTVGQSNFDKQLSFVSNVADKMQIGADKTQVSTVTFSSGVDNQFPLNQYTNKVDLDKAIMSIPFKGGQTHTAEGIRYVTSNSFSPVNGARYDVPHVLVVVTNGQSGTLDLTKLAAQTARDNGVIIYSVGVGAGVDMAELQAMATDPDSRHLFTAQNYDALSSLSDLMSTKICNELPPDPTSLVAPTGCLNKADLVFMVDSSSSVGSTNFQKLEHFLKDVTEKLDVSKDGVHVGMMKYSTYPSTEFPLITYETRPEVMKAIEGMNFMGGGTNDADALTYLRNQMFSQNNGARGDVPRIAVMITDGGSSNAAAAIAAADKARQNNIGIITVGVGNRVNKAQLERIGDKPHSDNTFVVNNYDNLDTITDQLINQLCKVQSTVPSLTTSSPGGTLPPDPCQDKLTNCRSYGNQVCTGYKDWAQQNCARFCGICTPLYTTAPPACTDKLRNCPDYGRDTCNRLGSWAKDNCGLFCGLCGNDTSSTGYYGQCFYKGRAFSQGEKWYDGCDYECLCEDGASGRYKCNNRCPVYYNLPGDCTLVAQPGECCLQPVCNFNPTVNSVESSGHGLTSSGIDVCQYRTKQYFQSQTWRDGCDYQCRCTDASKGLYKCDDLCPVYHSIPPYCHLEQKAGECCQKPVCEFDQQSGSVQGYGTISGNGVGTSPSQQLPCMDAIANCNDYGKSVCTSFRGWAEDNCKQYCNLCPENSMVAPSPDDRCIYEGKFYYQGQSWNASCDTSCTCEDAKYGYYRCVNSCPSYNNLPNGCQKIQKAGDCCPTIQCDNGFFLTSATNLGSYGNGGKLNVSHPPSGLTQVVPTLPTGEIPSPGTGGTGFQAPTLRGCLYKGQLYVQGQAWEDGCDFSCYCKDAYNGLYSCRQKCPAYPSLPGSCHLVTDSNDVCCMSPECTKNPVTQKIPVPIPVFPPSYQSHSVVEPPMGTSGTEGYTMTVFLVQTGNTPAPPTAMSGAGTGGIGYCLYNGVHHKQGEMWDDGCEFNCVCQDASRGFYKCVDKCVHYGSLPKDCFLVKDPVNPCCDIPKCVFPVNYITHIGELVTTPKPSGESCVYQGESYQQGQTWYDECRYKCTCEDADNNIYRCLSRCPEYQNVDERCHFVPDPQDPSCCSMPQCDFPGTVTNHTGSNPVITPAPAGSFSGQGTGIGYCEYKGIHYAQGQAWQDGCAFNCVCTDASTGLYRCTEPCERFINLPEYCTLVTDFTNPCCKVPRCNFPATTAMITGMGTGSPVPHSTLIPTPGLPGQTPVPGPTEAPHFEECVYKGVGYAQGQSWTDGCSFRCRCDNADKGLYVCNERCATYDNIPAGCFMVTDPKDSCCLVPQCNVVAPTPKPAVPGVSTPVPTPFRIPTAAPGQIIGSVNVPTPRPNPDGSIPTPAPLTYCEYKGMQYTQGQKWDDGCQFTCECVDAHIGQYKCLEKCTRYVNIPANCRLSRDPANPCCKIPECTDVAPTPSPPSGGPTQSPALSPTPAPANMCVYKGKSYGQGQTWYDACDYICNCEDAMAGLYRCNNRCPQYDSNLPAGCHMEASSSDPLCCQEPKCVFIPTSNSTGYQPVPTPPMGVIDGGVATPTPKPAPFFVPTSRPGVSTMIPPTFAPTPAPRPHVCVYKGSEYQQGQKWQDGCDYNCECLDAIAGHYRCTEMCAKYDNLPKGCRLVRDIYNPCCQKAYCDPAQIPTPQPTGAPTPAPSPGVSTFVPPSPQPKSGCMYNGVLFTQGQQWNDGCDLKCVCEDQMSGFYRCTDRCASYDLPAYCTLVTDPRDSCCKVPKCDSVPPTPSPKPWVPGMVPTPAPGVTYAPNKVPTPAPGRTYAPGMYPTWVPGMVPTPAPGYTYAPNKVPTPAPGQTYPPGMYPTYVPGMVPTPAPGFTYAPNKIPTPAPGKTYAPGMYPTYVPGMVPTPAPGFTYAPNKIPTPAPGRTYAPGKYPTYVPGMVPTPAPGFTYAPNKIPTPAPGQTYAPGMYPTWVPGMVPTPAPGYTYPPYMVPTPAPGLTYAPGNFPVPTTTQSPTPRPGQTFPTWKPGMVPTPYPGATYAPNLIPTPSPGATYAPYSFPTWLPGMIPTVAPGITLPPWLVPTPAPGKTYAPFHYPTWVPGMVPTPAPHATFAPNKIPTPGPGRTYAPGNYPTYVPGMVPTPAPGFTYAPNKIPTPAPGQTYAPGMYPTWVPGMVPTPAPGFTYAPNRIPTPAPGQTFAPGMYPTYVPGMVPTPAPGVTYAPNRIPTPAPGQTYAPGMYPTYVPGMVPTPAPGLTYAPNKIPTPAPGRTYAPGMYPTWVPGMVPTPAPGFTYAPNKLPTPAPGQTYAPGLYPTYVPGMVPTPAPGYTYPPYMVPTPAPGLTYAPGNFPVPTTTQSPTPRPGQTFPTWKPGMVPTPYPGATYAPNLIPTPSPGATYAPYSFPTWLPGMIPTVAPGITLPPWLVPTPAPGKTYAPFHYPTWVPGMVPTPAPHATFAPNKIPTPAPGRTYAPGNYPTYVPGMVPTPAPGLTYAPNRIPTPAPGQTYAPGMYPTWLPGMVPTPAPGVTYAPNKIPTPAPGRTYAPGMYPTYVPGMVPTPAPGQTYAPNKIPTPGPGQTYAPGMYPTYVPGMVPTPAPGFTYAPNKIPTPAPGQTYAPGMYPTYVPGMVPTPAPGFTYAPNKIPTPAPGQTYAPGKYPTYVPGMVPTPAPGFTYAPNKIPTPAPGQTYAPGMYPTYVPGMVPTPAPGYTYPPYMVPTPGPGLTYAPGNFPVPTTTPFPTPRPGQTFPTWKPGMVPTPYPGGTYAPNLIPTPSPGATYAPNSFPTWVPGMIPTVAPGITLPPWLVPTPAPGKTYGPFQYPTWVPGMVPTPAPNATFAPNKIPTPAPGRTYAPGNYPTYVPGMVPTPAPGFTYAPNMIPTPAPGQTYAPGMYPTYVPGMVPTPAPGFTYAPNKIPTPAPGQTYAPGMYPTYLPGMVPTPAPGFTYAPNKIPTPAPGQTYAPGMYPTYVPGMVPTPAPGMTYAPNKIPTPAPGQTYAPGMYPTYVPGMVPTPAPGFTYAPNKIPTPAPGQTYAPGMYPTYVPGMVPTPAPGFTYAPNKIPTPAPGQTYAPGMYPTYVPGMVPTPAPGVTYAPNKIPTPAPGQTYAPGMYPTYVPGMVPTPAPGFTYAPNKIPTPAPGQTYAPGMYPTWVPGMVPTPAPGYTYPPYMVPTPAPGLTYAPGNFPVPTTTQSPTPRPGQTFPTWKPGMVPTPYPGATYAPNLIPTPSPGATYAPYSFPTWLPGMIPTVAPGISLPPWLVPTPAPGKTYAPFHYPTWVPGMVPTPAPHATFAPNKIPTPGPGRTYAPGNYPTYVPGMVPTPAPGLTYAPNRIPTPAPGQTYAPGMYPTYVPGMVPTPAPGFTYAPNKIPTPAPGQTYAPGMYPTYVPGMVPTPAPGKTYAPNMIPTPSPGRTYAPGMYPTWVPGMVPTPAPGFTYAPNMIPTPAPGQTYAPGMYPTWVPGMVPTPAPGLTYAPNKIPTPAPGQTYAPGMFPTPSPAPTPFNVPTAIPGIVQGSGVNPNPSITGCMYHGIVYNQGQKWQDGCKYDCECIDEHSGRYKCKERCSLFLNIPSYCRLVVDTKDACCKVPVCNPPTQAPAPTPRPTPQPTPRPIPGVSTNVPNPNPTQALTPQPKVTSCMYMGKNYLQGQSWYDGCDKKCVCEDGITGHYRCFDRCTIYKSVPNSCTMVADPNDPTCCKVPQCIPIPQPGNTIPTDKPFVVTGVTGIITGGGDITTPVPQPGMSTPAPNNVCIYGGRMYHQDQQWQDGCKYECMCTDAMTGKYQCVQRCAVYPFVPPECKMQRDPKDICCFVPVCDYNQTVPTPAPFGVPTPGPTPAPGVSTMVPPTMAPSTQNPLPSFCVYNGVAFRKGQTWNDGCTKKCRCDDADMNVYTCFDRCPSYNNLGANCVMVADPADSCCQVPKCTYVPTGAPTPRPVPGAPTPSPTPAPSPIPTAPTGVISGGPQPNPITGLTPTNVGYCLYKGNQYSKGQVWDDGCTYTCTCVDAMSGQYSCVQKCPRYVQIPSYCTMVQDPNDKCCKKPFCPGLTPTMAPTPGPSGATPVPTPGPGQPTLAPPKKDVCIMNGNSYTQGQKWYDGCQKICVCDDAKTGMYSCNDRCPSYQLQPNCVLVPDQRDPLCCQTPKCDSPNPTNLTATGVTGYITGQGTPPTPTNGPTPSPGSPTQAPTAAPPKVCVYKGKTYTQGQKWQDGCLYDCLCDDAMSGHYVCTDKCPRYPNLPANCRLVYDPLNPCCQKPQCDTPTQAPPAGVSTIAPSVNPYPTPSPSDFCVYQGVKLLQGQTFNQGCDKVCKCEDAMTGRITCTDRCPTYPAQKAGCTLVTDPKDPCCQIQSCVNTQNPSIIATGVPGTITGSNLPDSGNPYPGSTNTRNACIYNGKIYNQGQKWDDGCTYSCECVDASTGLYQCTEKCPRYPTLPSYCTMVQDPANSCCQKPYCTPLTNPQTGPSPTPGPHGQTPAPTMKVCVYKGNMYQQGQQWYDGCDYKCVCDNAATGHYACSDRCPANTNLQAGCTLKPDPRDPTCCEITDCPGVSTPAPSPGSPTLSPQPKGYCVYKGVYYTQGQTWMDGCTQKCRCEDVQKGYYTCTQRCPVYQNLGSSCQLKTDPNDACCLVPDCNHIPTPINTPAPGVATQVPFIVPTSITGSFIGSSGGNPVNVPYLPGSQITGSSNACVYKGSIYSQGQSWNDACNYKCVCIDASRGQYRCNDRCPKFFYLPPQCHFEQSPTDTCCKIAKCSTYIQPTTPKPITVVPNTSNGPSGSGTPGPVHTQFPPDHTGSVPVTAPVPTKCVYFNGMQYSQGQTWKDGCTQNCVCETPATNKFTCTNRCPSYSGLPAFCVLVTDASDACCKKPQCTLTSGVTLQPVIGGGFYGSATPPTSLQVLPIGTHEVITGGRPPVTGSFPGTAIGGRDRCIYKGSIYNQGQSWNDGCDWVCTCENATTGMYRCVSKCPQYPTLPSYCKKINVPGQCCQSITCDIPGYGTYNPVPQLVPSPLPTGTSPTGTTPDPQIILLPGGSGTTITGSGYPGGGYLLPNASNPTVSGQLRDKCIYNNRLYNQGESWDDACNYRCECLDARSGFYECKSLCPVYNNLPSNQCYLVKANGQCCSIPMCYDPSVGNFVNTQTSSSVFPVVGTYQGGFTGFRPSYVLPGPNFSNGSRNACVYKGVIYRQGDKWDDGCDFACDCRNEQEGLYICQTKCPTYTQIPPVCQLNSQPGACCKQLTCNSGSVTTPRSLMTPTPQVATTPQAHGNCTDKIQNCKSYGAQACQAPYVQWANRNCRRTCKICIDPAVSSSPQPCADKLANCVDYGNTSCTGIYEPWAKDNCRHSCGFCTDTGTTAPSAVVTTAATCVDEYPDCAGLGQFYCTDNFRDWSLQNCKKYCNWCNGAGATTTPVAQTTTDNIYSWLLMMKGVAGAPGPDLYNLWHSSQTLNPTVPLASHLTSEFNGHYKPDYSNHWNEYCIDKVKVSIYNQGVEKANIIFDANGADKNSWFDKSRIIDSTWSDIKTAPKDIFSLSGDPVTGREFYASAQSSGCDAYGWMMISTKSTCFYEMGDAKPTFYYAPGTSQAHWGFTNPETGDVFAIQAHPTCFPGQVTVSTPPPNHCEYAGVKYNQGANWVDGCKYNCTCVDASLGLYRCSSLCPDYTSLSAGCNIVKKPGECCGVPDCGGVLITKAPTTIVVMPSKTCYYNGNYYRQDETWNDGCRQTCTCTDATSGSYSCRAKCLNFNGILPSQCSLLDPAPGQCCKQPRCPSGIVIQIPKNFKTDYPGPGYVYV